MEMATLKMCFSFLLFSFLHTVFEQFFGVRQGDSGGVVSGDWAH